MLPTPTPTGWTYNGTTYPSLHAALAAKRTHEAATTGVSAAAADVAVRRTANKKRPAQR